MPFRHTLCNHQCSLYIKPNNTQNKTANHDKQSGPQNKKKLKPKPTEPSSPVRTSHMSEHIIVHNFGFGTQCITDYRPVASF